MAVWSSLHNAHTTLETGRRASTRTFICTRCGGEFPSKRSGKYCGPCSADRYYETTAANRARHRPVPPDQRKPRKDSIQALGLAARAAGLTVKDIEALAAQRGAS